MNAQIIEKKVDVTIELEKKEEALLYEAFDLLERISDVLTSNDLYDDDYFTISVWETNYQNCSTVKRQVYELVDLREKFDELLW